MNFEPVFTKKIPGAPNTGTIRQYLSDLKAKRRLDFAKDATYVLIFSEQNNHGRISPMASMDELHAKLKQGNASYFFLIHVNSQPFGSYDDKSDVQMINDTFKMLKTNQMDVIFYDYIIVSQEGYFLGTLSCKGAGFWNATKKAAPKDD